MQQVLVVKLLQVLAPSSEWVCDQAIQGGCSLSLPPLLSLALPPLYRTHLTDLPS